MAERDHDRTDGPSDGPDRKPSGALGGAPVNPNETAPKHALPDPPEGGNKQPREQDAVEAEPGQDL
jgi:hypothetical protein